MGKSIISIMSMLIVTILAGSVIADEISKQGNKYDFRKTKWGMSQEEVISAEPSLFISKDDNEIVYKTRILESNFGLKYRFINENLIGATYFLEDKYLRTKSYEDTYNVLVKSLTKKYGDPNNNEVIWLDRTYKDDPNKKNYALSAGHIQYFSFWSTEKANIKCTLHGEFHNLILKIDYVSILYEEISKKQEVIKDPF